MPEFEPKATLPDPYIMSSATPVTMRAPQETVLKEAPDTAENPLVGGSPLHDFWRQRFRRFTLQGDLQKWLSRAARADLIRPAIVHNGTWYYSTFQLWPMWYYSPLTRFRRDTVRAERIDAFDAIVRLLCRIQDYYLPLVRSDQRYGVRREYMGRPAGIAGTSFHSSTHYVLYSLRRWKEDRIQDGEFNPAFVLAESGLSPAGIRNCISHLTSAASSIDPLESWQLLTRFVSYEKRQKLRFDALIALDFRETAEILRLFHADASSEPICQDLAEWGSSGPKESWLREEYGGSLDHPCELLEYLLNGFGLNVKPQAIVFTEGEEWQALSFLYEEVGAHPSYAGVEFRSLSGIGNFSVANWQTFIEYMHDHQTLIYFVIDREGRAASEVRKLLKGKRRFTRPPLTKVIPSPDRLCLWSSSFEEANFTDDEIARAVGLQGLNCTAAQVSMLRGASRGLISALAGQSCVILDKRRLALDLARHLVDWRRSNPHEPQRPLEVFIGHSAEMIVLNHQPTSPSCREQNFETGLLG